MKQTCLPKRGNGGQRREINQEFDINIHTLLLPLLLLSCFSRARLCATLWTAAHQAPLSMGFSRQEYWSGLPFPSPVHTLLCIKQENNKDLLYSAGNYTQYLVTTSKGEESEKEHLCIYICITESLCCTLETNITL